MFYGSQIVFCVSVRVCILLVRMCFLSLTVFVLYVSEFFHFDARVLCCRSVLCVNESVFFQ